MQTNPACRRRHGTDAPGRAGRTVAAVSYLNTEPLIFGLRDRSDLELVCDVPSKLLEILTAGKADMALCPAIDFQLSAVPLTIVPVGAIGSDGSSLTVRLFSKRPLEAIDEIWVDRDSHTSVALLQVVMAQRFASRPALRKLQLDPQTIGTGSRQLLPEPAQAMLLIGDKVVTARPARRRFPHQLDLGAAWKRLTGLPFVFATWMAQPHTELGRLPTLLEEQRLANRSNITEIAVQGALRRGWPRDIAIAYLSRNIRYEIREPELRSLELFWSLCLEHGLIDRLKPLALYEPTPASGPGESRRTDCRDIGSTEPTLPDTHAGTRDHRSGHHR